MLCWCWWWKWQGQQWQGFLRSDDKKKDNHDDKYDDHGDKDDKYDNYDDKGCRTYDEPPTLRPDQATRENLSQSRRRRPPARLSLEKRRFLQLGTEFKLVIYDKYFTSYQTLLIVHHQFGL